MGTRSDRDLERLIPIQQVLRAPHIPDTNNNKMIIINKNNNNIINASSSASASASGRGGTAPSNSSSDSESASPVVSASHRLTTPGKEALYKVIRSWASKKFMSGCVILLPIAITFCITWWFIRSVDGFFSPIYTHLGINVFGLGFFTSITFIFLIGVFTSSWLGASLLKLGEWFIKKMPLISYIYSASKQISAAISPDQGSNAFKEVVIIRHPRNGEYAFGFITSNVILRVAMGTEEELCCVYVPTNHLYLGDIFLVSSGDVMKPNLSVREGIEIVISGGMSVPQILTAMDAQAMRPAGLGKYAIPPIEIDSPAMRGDQPMNATLTEEVGVGSVVKRDRKDEKLDRNEIARTIRAVVLEETREKIRKKAKEIKECIREKGDKDIDEAVNDLIGLCGKGTDKLV